MSNGNGDSWTSIADDALPERDMVLVIKAFLEGRGEGGATEEEIQEIVRWARMTRVQGLILDAALQGYICLDWRNGDVVFVGSRSRA